MICLTIILILPSTANHMKEMKKNFENTFACLTSMSTLHSHFRCEKLRLPDPLGHFCTEEWTKDLLAHTEFLDVHEYHKRFYPDFANYIDDVLRLRQMEETSVVSASS
jgi:hypothetical protein